MYASFNDTTMRRTLGRMLPSAQRGASEIARMSGRIEALLHESGASLETNKRIRKADRTMPWGKLIIIGLLALSQSAFAQLTVPPRPGGPLPPNSPPPPPPPPP